MMHTENKKGITRVGMNASDIFMFETGVETIRANLVRRGLDEKAVEAMRFEIAAFAYDPAVCDYNIYADGKPFYAVSISVNAPIGNSAVAPDTPLHAVPAEVLPHLLAFEIGYNCLGNIGRLVHLMEKEGEYQTGSLEISFHTSHFENTFRGSVSGFVQMLNEIVDMRFDQIVPKKPLPKGGFKPSV